MKKWIQSTLGQISIGLLTIVIGAILGINTWNPYSNNKTNYILLKEPDRNNEKEIRGLDPDVKKRTKGTSKSSISRLVNPAVFNSKSQLNIGFLIRNESSLSLETSNGISNELFNDGIIGNTSLFTKYALSKYQNFYNADPLLMSEVNLISHTDFYLVGTVKEEISANPVNRSMKKSTLVFDGRLVNVNTKYMVPVSHTEYGAGFSNSESLMNAYKSLTKKVANQIATSIKK